MAQNPDPQEQFGSFLVIASSLIAAVIAGGVAAAAFGACAFIAVAVLTGLAYPFVGAFLVPVCEELRAWANPKQEDLKDWTRSERIIIGAVWPLSVPALTILYVFLGIIARVY